MNIEVLPEAVASQIAAGEVIERPASVVKELLENALDAEADTITIRIMSAGKRLIEVTDNGSGIPLLDLPVAVLRHATSKLRSAEELFRVNTLGFRGEALASIGSVARLRITSRTREEQTGARIEVDAGKASKIVKVGSPPGTQVIVEDLFYNVPARLKFLKQEGTEKKHIDSLIMRYALAYPQVRFHLQQDGKNVIQTGGSGDRREVLGVIYGVELARRMLAVNREDPAYYLEGFISPPDHSRSNRREIHIYVNGRPVQDIALSTALVHAYHNFLMVGRYPMAHLFLQVPAEVVDVNVHPAKAEVRFRKPDEIFSFIQNSVRKALLAYSPIPEVNSAAGWGTSAWSLPVSGSEKEQSSWLSPGRSNLVPESQTEGQVSTGVEQPGLPGKIPLLRLIGQVATAFLVAEGPDGLYLIDQHAAHERILFEKMMAAQRQRTDRGEKLPAQGLMEPEAVLLAPDEARSLESQLPILNTLGFEVELFGKGVFLVRTLPVILSHMNPEAALRVLVEDFEEDETPLQSEIEAKIIGRVCKRAAVKAGKVLSTEEQVKLIADLEACASPRTCPHGRPTMIHLSVDLLQRQFGRKGSL